MTTSNFDAIFIGVATIDTIALVDNYPAADSRTLTDHLERAGGGVSATAAVAAARLGASVAVAGVVGDDAEGKEIIAGLKNEGVNTDLIVVDKNSKSATSAVIVTQSTATRAIITRQQVNYAA
jgi:sugar/nucleoside kinase (ribokinase family)